jgi:hypothetical protein
VQPSKGRNGILQLRLPCHLIVIVIVIALPAPNKTRPRLHDDDDILDAQIEVPLGA